MHNIHRGQHAIRVWLDKNDYASKIEDGQVLVLTKAKKVEVIENMRAAIEFVINDSTNL